MKNIIWIVVVAGLLVTFGCTEQKPEEAARKIVDQQVAIHHEGFKLDTSKVSYKVVEQGDKQAIVEVSGNIAVKAVIPLVKKSGEWVLDMPVDKAPEKKAAGH